MREWLIQAGLAAAAYAGPILTRTGHPGQRGPIARRTISSGRRDTVVSWRGRDYVRKPPPGTRLDEERRRRNRLPCGFLQRVRPPKGRDPKIENPAVSERVKEARRTRCVPCSPALAQLLLVTDRLRAQPSDGGPGFPARASTEPSARHAGQPSQNGDPGPRRLRPRATPAESARTRTCGGRPGPGTRRLLGRSGAGRAPAPSRRAAESTGNVRCSPAPRRPPRAARQRRTPGPAVRRTAAQAQAAEGGEGPQTAPARRGNTARGDTAAMAADREGDRWRHRPPEAPAPGEEPGQG